MMSSLMPSEKYSCSGSPLMLENGSTAIAGRSGRASAGRASRPAALVRAAVLLDLHVADKAQALARDGADQPLLVAVVADRLADGIDPAGQRRFRDDAAAPDRRDQVVLADDAVAVLDQADQQVEHLRLHGARARRRAAVRAGRCRGRSFQTGTAKSAPVPGRSSSKPTPVRLRRCVPKNRLISSRLSAGRMRRASVSVAARLFGPVEPQQRAGRNHARAVEPAVAPRGVASRRRAPPRCRPARRSPSARSMLQKVRRKSLGLERMPNLHALDALFEPAPFDLGHAERDVGLRVAGIELERAEQYRVAAFGVADIDQRAAGEAQHVRCVRIDGDRALRLLAGGPLGGGDIGHQRQARAESADDGEHRPRQREFGVDRDRLPQLRERLGDRLLAPALHRDGADGLAKHATRRRRCRCAAAAPTKSPPWSARAPARP